MNKPKGELFNFLSKRIKDKLVFDIGANEGGMTKQYIDFGARVVAVEPQKELTKSTNFSGVFAIRHTCVSETVGDVDFFECVGHNVSSSCLVDWQKHYPQKEWKKTSIKSTTLDTLIEEFGKPKFIKLDVEGFEDKVLLGLSQKIDLISFEFTKGFIDSSIRCVEILDKIGFKKMMPCIKRKLNKRKNGRKIRLYEYFEEFSTKEEVIKYLNSISKKPVKNFQGDILVIS